MAEKVRGAGGAVRWWSGATAEELGEAAAGDPVAVLPLAATEQHGPHLPLSTDLDIGLGLLERAFQELDDDTPAWALPPQAVGASSEHAGFSGTVSLETELLARTVEEIGASVARAGVRRLVLHSSHGGNRPALDTAALRLRRAHGMLVARVSHFGLPRPEAVRLPEAEWRHGLHGGAVETAMMLHLHPGRVRTERIQEALSLGRELEAELEWLAPEGPASFAWLAGDLHPSGAVGDAALADAGMGRALVDHYGRILAGVIRDARRFPLERLR